MTYYYEPRGVCSRNFEIDLEDGVIQEIRIQNGCDGNLQGISQLVKGEKADRVAEKLRGIRCASKMTSCPDQLAKAIESALKQERKKKGGAG